MGNSNTVCHRCLRGARGDSSGNGLDDGGGSRLVLAVSAAADEDQDNFSATPGSSEFANGSNSGPAAAAAAAGSTESESLVASSDSSGRRTRLLPHATFPFTAEEASLAWLRANRVLFIMRGLPGSGKSTLVRLLRQLNPGAVVCSADTYLTDPATGAYNFDPDRRSQAHSECNNQAYSAMSAAKSPVIVDNTNVRRWEFKFYLDMAKRFGYLTLLVLPKTPWRFDAQALANRTVHAVPLETIEQRLTSWEAAHPTFYAWFLDSAEAAGLLRLARDFLDCLAAAGVGGPASPPQLPSPQQLQQRLLHVTARFCGRRGGAGSGQQEAVAQLDFHNRPDVQAALGRVFSATASAIFVTSRSIGFKLDLTPEQLALWDNDEPSNPAADSPRLPRGSRAHVTLATAAGVPAVQAGMDLLAILRAAAAEPEPGPDDLVLMTEWGFARGCGPDACLLSLDQPVCLTTMFAASY